MGVSLPASGSQSASITVADEGETIAFFDATFFKMMSIQWAWSNGSTAGGDIELVATNDTSVGWETLTYSGTTKTISGASGHDAIDVIETGFRYIGIALSSIAGTYDITFYFQGKA